MKTTHTKSNTSQTFPKHYILKSLLVFLITFLVINSVVHMQLLSQKSGEQTKAAYAAETTASQIQAYLNQYLSVSSLLKQVVEQHGTISDTEFRNLSRFWTNSNDSALKSIEMAPDGVITQIYPLDGNESASGLDLLTHPERSKWAVHAKETGKFTIAGPFTLVQGNSGILLIDPIYRKKDDLNTFWGFSVLVLDWQHFLHDIGLDDPEASFYRYTISRKDINTDSDLVLLQSDDTDMQDALVVPCTIADETWNVSIKPATGWISRLNLVIDFLICMLLSAFITLIFMQYKLHIQKEKQYTAEIMQAARKMQVANDAKTRFLFNMSHDLRTPINAIIGFSELLQKHTDDTTRIESYAQKILDSSNILLSIINHVLEMSRIESGKESLSEEVGNAKDLIRIIDAVFENTIREKQLTCEYHVDVQHEYAVFDVTKVQEIFLNIMSNAVKYTPAGGHIRADVVELSSDEDQYATYRITVADTGIGMSEDFLPHLFEEFAREHTSTETKINGTGLGMPIVKALIELMGGTISVDSHPGQGTRITVDLPLRIADATQVASIQKEQPDSVQTSLSGRRILLAEDNDLNAEIAMTILDENGLLVDHATDGIQCIKMLTSQPVDYYYAILMDIQMPNMDGYHAAKTIRQLHDPRSQTPIIAMTANAFEEDKKRAFSVGMNGYIAKPIHMESVLEVLQKIPTDI